MKIEGIELNPDHVAEGRRLFSLGDRLREGDEGSLTVLPDNYVDVTFTVSVLDHMPDVRQCLSNMMRISRLRVILIELVLSNVGKVVEPGVVDYSYSHDLPALAEELGVALVSCVKTPLGEGILEHYETVELLPS